MSHWRSSCQTEMLVQSREGAASRQDASQVLDTVSSRLRPDYLCVSPRGSRAVLQFQRALQLYNALR
jgi:hypothetical protein